MARKKVPEREITIKVRGELPKLRDKGCYKVLLYNLEQALASSENPEECAPTIIDIMNQLCEADKIPRREDVDVLIS